MSLSERVAALEGSATADDQIAKDLRVMGTYVSRVELKLLEFEQRNTSWTRPAFPLLMTECVEV